MRKKFLKILAFLCIDHYLLVLLVALICTGISLYCISKLSVDTTFIRLLPEKEPEVQFFQKVTKEYGSSTDLYLLIHFRDFDKACSFVEDLKPKLEALSEIREVRNQFIDVSYLEKHAPLFLSIRELRLAHRTLNRVLPSLKKILKNPQLSSIFRESNQYLFREMAFATTLQLSGVTSKSHLILRRLAAFCDLFQRYGLDGKKLGDRPVQQFMEENFLQNQNLFQGRGTLRKGYLVSSDGRSMLVQVKLSVNMLETEIGMKIYGEILRRTQEVQKAHPQVQFGYTGHFAIGYEDQQNVLSRIGFLSIVSLVLVLLLFIYVDRTLYGPLLVAIPLLLAVLWTFGFVQLYFGFVSITSAIFGILLFGLGVDFAIHFMVAFHDEAARGQTIETSLEKALFLSGPAILIGGLTTACSFFALNVSEFKAAKHLGTTSGWGILCCLLAMLVVLPSMIMLAKKFFGKKRQIFVSMDIPLLDRWVRFVCARPYLTLLLSALLTVGLGLNVFTLKLQYDLEKMITRNLSSVAVKKKMEKTFHISTDFLFVLTRSEKKSRQLALQIAQKKNSRGEFLFSRVESIGNYIPSHQNQKMEILQKIQTKLRNLPAPCPKAPEVGPLQIAEMVAQLKTFEKFISIFAVLSPSHKKICQKLLQKLQNCKALLKGEKTTQLAKNLTYFQQLLFQKLIHNFRKLRITTYSPITLANLPASIRETFLGKHQKFFAIYAYPRHSIFNKENIEEALRATRSKDSKSTGHMVMVYHFIYLGLKDFPLVAFTVIVLVVLLLFLDFHNPFYVALALVPIGCGAVISLGIFCLAREPVNIITLLCFPLIFGIGIDDGVHMIHRYRETAHGDIEKTIASTGKAILLTTVTTMTSFGILLFTNHYSLIGMGKLILLGVGLCFFASVTILPPLLVLGERWGILKNDDEGEN